MEYVRTYLRPAFLICVAVLAIAASGMSIAIKSFGIYLKKEPLSLRKSLDLLDEKDLAPYRVVRKMKIDNEDVIKSLGTEDYIQWVLECADEQADSTVRKCMLFITYYGLPDRVPHVPEDCYTGSGHQKLASGSVMFEIDRSSGREKIPGRYLIFSGVNSNNWWSSKKFPVLYLFNINGLYKSGREGVRTVLSRNLRGKYSYFAKIEWKFFNRSLGMVVYPSKEEAITASQKLLSVILPILERDHWPIWEDAVSSE